jgi:uncharacterized protein YacL
MLGGYAVSELHSGLIGHWGLGLIIGFGLGGLLIALDEMLKGFSLRAFSAATFGLILGSIIAWLVDVSGLFEWALPDVRWLIRIGLFLSFGYIGIILAMRSNKEDFSLIIPYVRFASRNKPENPLVLDTSAIIDGRVAELIECRYLEGLIVVPRFVLRELQAIADSADPVRRSRGRRGLEMLNRIQQGARNEVKIHEGDFAEEPDVDARLVRLARTLQGKLITTDYNLGKIAEIQSVAHINIADLATRLKPAILPGEMLTLRLVREGKEKGQGVGYLSDGTMVVVNQGQPHIGTQVQAEVTSLVQTGAGVIVFAEIKG